MYEAVLGSRPEMPRSRPGTKMKVPWTLYIAQDQDQDQDKDKSRSRLVLNPTLVCGAVYTLNGS